MVEGWCWDGWQREFLSYDGNAALRCGRQCGKSEVVSSKAVDFALKHPGTVTMIIAASQRQSGLLFEKVRAKIDLMEQPELYAEPPTLTRIILSNGSRIYSFPTGRTGHYIRGYTVDFLIADEAALIPEAVWLALTPMIAVSKKTRGFGWIILLSTTFGKGGFFYDACMSKDFRQWHVSSEDCPRLGADYLRRERQRMSKEQYAQEYLAEFIDEYRQFFPTELLKRQMTFIDWSLEERVPGSRFYLGVDVARYGGDENAFVVAELVGKRLKVVKCLTTERVSVTDTIGQVIELDRAYGFARVFVDDTGIGGGVTDLLQERLGKRRGVGINNASKRLEMQGDERKKGILKEDLYSHALMLLESGHLELISDLDLLRSMKSITFEYTEHGKVRIGGKDSHLTEALVRACWGLKERGLDIYIF